MRISGRWAFRLNEARVEVMVLGLPVAFWLLGAIAAAAALIYLPFLAVGYARAKLGYDQSAPRAMFDQLPDYAKRATWAHENAIETFPIFAAAAVISYVTGVENAVAAWAAIAFVVARTFYPIAYIANVPVLRSLCFATGSTAVIVLFAQSLSRVLA